MDVLNAEPWIASEWIQRKYQNRRPALRLITDAGCGGRNMGMVRDLPVTFNLSARSYAYRELEEHQSVIPPEKFHDPMAELE